MSANALSVDTELVDTGLVDTGSVNSESDELWSELDSAEKKVMTLERDAVNYPQSIIKLNRPQLESLLAPLSDIKFQSTGLMIKKRIVHTARQFS